MCPSLQIASPAVVCVCVCDGVFITNFIIQISKTLSSKYQQLHHTRVSRGKLQPRCCMCVCARNGAFVTNSIIRISNTPSSKYQQLHQTCDSRGILPTCWCLCVCEREGVFLTNSIIQSTCSVYHEHHFMFTNSISYMVVSVEQSHELYHPNYHELCHPNIQDTIIYISTPPSYMRSSWNCNPAGICVCVSEDVFITNSIISIPRTLSSKYQQLHHTCVSRDILQPQCYMRVCVRENVYHEPHILHIPRRLSST